MTYLPSCAVAGMSLVAVVVLRLAANFPTCTLSDLVRMLWGWSGSALLCSDGCAAASCGEWLTHVVPANRHLVQQHAQVLPDRSEVSAAVCCLKGSNNQERHSQGREFLGLLCVRPAIGWHDRFYAVLNVLQHKVGVG
jgi:hypothetical protein